MVDAQLLQKRQPVAVAVGVREVLGRDGMERERELRIENCLPSVALAEEGELGIVEEVGEGELERGVFQMGADDDVRERIVV